MIRGIPDSVLHLAMGREAWGGGGAGNVDPVGEVGVKATSVTPVYPTVYRPNLGTYLAWYLPSYV